MLSRSVIVWKIVTPNFLIGIYSISLKLGYLIIFDVMFMFICLSNVCWDHRWFFFPMRTNIDKLCCRQRLKNFPLKQISLMLGYFFPKDFIFFCQLLNSAKTFYFKAISMQESIEFLIVEKLNDLSRNCTSVDLTLWIIHRGSERRRMKK